MKEVLPFIPVRLQTQVVLSQSTLGSGRLGSGPLGQVPDAVLRLVQNARNKPALIQRAMAYTIPTSQLSGLIPLLARADDPALQQTAQRLLSVRLRPRLADPIWQQLQDQPECVIYSELMLQLARDALAARPGLSAADLEPSIELAARHPRPSTLVNPCRLPLCHSQPDTIWSSTPAAASRSLMCSSSSTSASPAPGSETC